MFHIITPWDRIPVILQLKKKREGIKSNAFDIPVGLFTSTLAC